MACAVAKCKCVQFKPQKWISLKCHTCYHWESEHTLPTPHLSVNPDLGEMGGPGTPRLTLSRSSSPTSPMSPRNANSTFLSPRKPPPSPPPFTTHTRARPPPPPPASATKPKDEEIKLFVIPNTPQHRKAAASEENSVRQSISGDDNSPNKTIRGLLERYSDDQSIRSVKGSHLERHSEDFSMRSLKDFPSERLVEDASLKSVIHGDQTDFSQWKGVDSPTDDDKGGAQKDGSLKTVKSVSTEESSVRNGSINDDKSARRSPRAPKATLVDLARHPSLDDPNLHLRLELRGPPVFPSKIRRGGFIDLEHEALMPAAGGNSPTVSSRPSMSSGSVETASLSRPPDLDDHLSSRGSDLLGSMQLRHSLSNEETRELKDSRSETTPPMSLSRLRRSSSVCHALERRLSGIERRLSVVEQLLDVEPRKLDPTVSASIDEEQRKSVQDMVSDALLIIKQHDELSPEQTSALENMVRSGSMTRVQRAISILETKSVQDTLPENPVQSSRTKSRQDASPRGSASGSSVSKSPKKLVADNANVSISYTPIHDHVQEREEPLLQTLALGTDPARSAVLLDRFMPKRILGSGANGCAIMVLRKEEGVRYAAKFIPLFTNAAELDPNRIFMEPAYSEALISCLVSGLPHYITCEEVFTVDYFTLSAWFATMRVPILSRNEKAKEHELKQAQITFLSRFRSSKAKSYLVVVQELCQMTLDHFLVLHRRSLHEPVPLVDEHFSLSLPPCSPDEMRYIMFAVTYALLIGKLTLGLLWNDLANRNILLQPLEGEPQANYTYHVRDSHDGFDETFIVPGHCLPQVNGYYFEVKLVDFGVAEVHGGARYTRKEKRLYRSMTDKRVMKVAGGLEDKDLIDLEGTLMRTLHTDHLKDVPSELLSDRVPKHKKTGWLEHQTKTEAAAAASHDWYLSILKGRPAIQTLKRALKHKFYRPFRQKSRPSPASPPAAITTPKTSHNYLEPSSKSRSGSNLFSFHTASASSSSSTSSSTSSTLCSNPASPSSSVATISGSSNAPSSASSSFRSLRSQKPAEEPTYEIAYPNNSRSRARLASLSGTLASRLGQHSDVIAQDSFDFEVEV